ncbi:protein SPATA31F1-like isoform X2 [Dipodomys merriami]|uniref:protein SPATA31F1-like isoform X2 n=1 Tax=Dipodomys merriami TaxID=94247 RepID=UPI00384AA900
MGNQNGQKLEMFQELMNLAKRLIQEGETPWELLSIMKSQGWLPQEKSVRKLLCADPHCKICNTAALEIRELLEVDTSQFTTSVPFEQKLKLHPQHSRDTELRSVTPRVTEPFAESTKVVDIQEYWNDQLLIQQDIQLPEMSLDSEMVASSRLEETAVILNEQETQTTPNGVQGNWDHDSLNLQVSFPCPNLEITCLPHPMVMQIIPSAHLPFVKPEILRLLELHVKKWMHFQRWGLPRRVEQSLRQLMPSPPMCYQPETNQPESFILTNTPQTCIHRFGTIFHEAWCPFMADQHIQIFWVSEWSITDPVQRHHCQHIPNPMAITLPSPTLEVLEGLCPLSGEQTNSSRSNLQQKHYQLFCGLPSLHSESLVATLLGPQSLAKNMSYPFVKDLHLFKEYSYPPLLTQPCLESPQPSSSPCPKGESPTQHQELPITVPFLTLDECKTLEWHLLQRQLQLQWGLPAAFHRSQHAQSPMQCELCNKARSLKIQKTLRTEQLSILTRELIFFPEHARRLLGFHLQKHLMHLRWGLPEKIQKSIQLLLSSTGQQPLSLSNKALPNMSISQPGAPEAKGDGCLFSPMISQVSVPMPHFFVQAQAMLQSHIDSKCVQIHQGKVPDLVYSSWECRIPGVLAMAPFADMLQGKLLELQAASEPDLYHNVVPCEPMAPGQQPEALLDSVIEHHKLPQAQSEETFEKQALPSAATEHQELLPALSEETIEKQALPNSAIEYHELPQALSEENIEKQALPTVGTEHQELLQALSEETIEKQALPCAATKFHELFQALPEETTEKQALPTAATKHHELPQAQPEETIEKQALPGAATEYQKRPQTLSDETIEKLETTLRHKYLAFLSGLPALYYVALSRVTSPVDTNQSVITEMVSKSIKIPQEPLVQMLSLEASVKSPGPCFQDDNRPCEVTGEKSQPELQVEAETERAPPKKQVLSVSPCLLNTHMLAKLNFHLKKKVLEIQLGIPEGARKSRKPNVAVPEHKSSQECPQSKKHQGNTVLQELPLDPPPASKWLCPKEKQATEQATELEAIQHNQKHPGLKAVPYGSAPWVSEIPQPSRDMTEAQVLCVQVQTNVSHPSLEKPQSPEPQSPGKSKDLAHVSMLARKREDHPEKLEAAGDPGGGDAGFGLSSATEDRPHAEVQRPEGILLNKIPQGSWRWKYDFHPVKPCQHSSQNLPQPESIPRGRESAHDLPHRLSKLNGIFSPERTPNTAQPVAAHAPQGQPFLDQLIQDQLLQSPACKGQVLKGLMRPAPAHRETRLADTGLRSKLKSFLYRMSPEMKGKGHLESTSSTAGKEAKPRMENVLSSLAHAPSPMKRTKTKKPMEHPKVQPDPTESPVGTASFLAGPPSPGNKLRLRSRQGSASVLGQPLHCPQHCPQVAYATQPGNTP